MSVTRREIDLFILHVANIVRVPPFKRSALGMLCTPDMSPATPTLVVDVARLMLDSLLLTSVGQLELISVADTYESYRVDEKHILTYFNVRPFSGATGHWIRVLCENDNAELGYYFDGYDIMVDFVTPPNNGTTKETYGIVMPSDSTNKDTLAIVSMNELTTGTASYKLVSPGFSLEIEGMPIIGKTEVAFSDCAVPIERGIFCDSEAIEDWRDQFRGREPFLNISVYFYHEMPMISIVINGGRYIYVTRKQDGGFRFQISDDIRDHQLVGIRELAQAILGNEFPIAADAYYEYDPRLDHEDVCFSIHDSDDDWSFAEPAVINTMSDDEY